MKQKINILELDPPVRNRIIDWPLVLHDIYREGMSYTRLARRVGVSKTSVHYWLNGLISPNGEKANMVLNIWKWLTRKSFEDIHLKDERYVYFEVSKKRRCRRRYNLKNKLT